MALRMRIVKHLFLFMLVVSVGLAGWGAWFVYGPLPLKQSPLAFDLKPGSGLRSVSQQLVSAGVLREPWRFELLARLAGVETSVKAGNYEIDDSVSALDLLRKITRGDYTQVAITFVEGWTFGQLRKALDDHPAIRHDTAGLGDADVLKRLGIDQPSAEGWFMPDTYYFGNGTSDLSILARAHNLMRLRLDAQWNARAAGLPLKTPYEALILASIVEKETGQAAERPLIAAVFVNRLRIGMRLQTDPTVIYGLGDAFDGNLRKRDLLADTPYNTYTRAGLPPTPIAMPGVASIRAALNPADSNALYFVARGDGTSYFSRTLEEHERAVTKYQRSGKR